MSIIITTPAETTDLCLVSQVRDALSIDDQSKDATLELLVRAATAAVEDYTGMVYAKQTYQETISGSDTDILMLSRTPIASVTEVLCDSEPIVDFDVRDAQSGMLYREVGWARSAWIGWDVEETRSVIEEPTFVITYEAGYDLPTDTAEGDLPANITQATIMTAVQMYRRQKRDADISSKKVGDLSISYRQGTDGSDPATAIPPAARSLLSRRLV